MFLQKTSRRVIPEIKRGLLEVELDTVVPMELKKNHPNSYIRSISMKTTPIYICEILNYTHSYIIQLLVTHLNIRWFGLVYGV